MVASRLARHDSWLKRVPTVVGASPGRARSAVDAGNEIGGPEIDAAPGVEAFSGDLAAFLKYLEAIMNKPNGVLFIAGTFRDLDEQLFFAEANIDVAHLGEFAQGA